MGRKAIGDAAAQRGPKQAEEVETELVGELAEVAHEDLQAVLGLPLGQSLAALLQHDHPTLLGQCLRHVRPVVGAAREARQDDQRRAAGPLPIQVVELDLA